MLENSHLELARPQIEWLEVADSPQLWRDLGYEVDEQGKCFVGGVEHRLVGSSAQERGLTRWALSGIDPGITSIDGIATVTVGAESSRVKSQASHPNGVTAIDHLVIRTSSTPRTASALQAIGLERRGQSDSTSSGEKVDMTFFWIGKTLLEIVGPAVPSDDSKPAYFMGVAYVSEDLDATASHFGDLCSRPKNAVQPGRRIAALRSEAGSTMATAFMTPHVKAGND